MGKVGSPYSELKVSSITAVSKLTNQTVELLDSPVYIGSNFIPQNIESKKNYYYKFQKKSFLTNIFPRKIL